jgi:hypothetical protein
MGVGLALHFGACIAYGPRIQRYLESFGESPTFFGFNWSFHQDYLRARRIAKRWGHRPEFLRRFELAEGVACVVLVGGLVVMIVSEISGHP